MVEEMQVKNRRDGKWECSRLIVTAVLDELCSRSGFDNWWCGIDKATRVDIEDTLTFEICKVPFIPPAAAEDGK